MLWKKLSSTRFTCVLQGGSLLFLVLVSSEANLSAEEASLSTAETSLSASGPGLSASKANLSALEASLSASEANQSEQEAEVLQLCLATELGRVLLRS